MKDGAQLGCYGISICYSEKSKLCKSCKIKPDCMDECKREVLKMAEKIDVSDIVRRFKTSKVKNQVIQTKYLERMTSIDDSKRPLSSDEELFARSLPQKAGNVARTLLSKDIDLLDHLENRINPFKTGNLAYLGATFQMLFEGGFTRRDLKDRFIETFNWTDSTAASYVSVTIALMLGLKAISARGNTMIIRQTK